MDNSHKGSSDAQDGPTKCRVDYGNVTAEAIDTMPGLAHALATALGTVRGTHTGAGSACVTCRKAWARDRAPGAFGIVYTGDRPDDCHVMLICGDCTAEAGGNVAVLVRDFAEGHLGLTGFRRAHAGGAA